MRSALQALACALLTTLAAVSPARADVVQFNGSGFVPNSGSPPLKLDFRAAATKSGATTAHFWLDLYNNNPVPVSLVVCTMLDLNVATVPHDTVHMTVGNGAGNPWVCNQQGGFSHYPSYYFGCIPVNIPAGGTANPIDRVATFSVSFTTQELGMVYMDFLQGQPVVLVFGTVVAMPASMSGLPWDWSGKTSPRSWAIVVSRGSPYWFCLSVVYALALGAPSFPRFEL